MDARLLFLCWPTRHRNLQSGWTYQAWKTIWKGGWEDGQKQEGSFSFSCLESSLFLKLPSVRNAPPSSKLLHFFSSRLTSPQAHTVWVTNPSFSSTIAPPPFSHWLFYSLIPVATAPSFPFPSPLLFPLLFLLVAHTNQLTAKELLCPSHTDRALNPIFPQKKLRHYSKGSYCSSLKVQKQLLL